MNKTIKSVKIIISGHVQGVGFRYSAIQVAKHYNISGWVKNNLDGTVEIVASGQEDKLDSFINKIKSSPTPFARIHDVTINYISNYEQKGFNVKY